MDSLLFRLHHRLFHYFFKKITKRPHPFTFSHVIVIKDIKTHVLSISIVAFKIKA